MSRLYESQYHRHFVCLHVRQTMDQPQVTYNKAALKQEMKDGPLEIAIV
jgi:hypothetical protein